MLGSIVDFIKGKLYHAFMKTIVWLIPLIIFLYGYIKFLERRSYFYPSKELSSNPDSAGIAYEDIFITTDDHKKIHAWFIPHDKPRYTLIFCHGNAGTIADRMEKIVFFHGLAFNVLIFSYRGYGKSSGSPSAQGLFRDAQAAYRYITETRKIDPSQLIIFGESLGGAVAIDAAARNKCRALILEGTFTSIKEMAKVYYPYIPNFLVSPVFDSIGKIKTIACPTLIFHSSEDEVIPCVQGQLLFNEAPEPKQFIMLHGSHNEAFLTASDKLKQEINAFLKTLSRHI